MKDLGRLVLKDKRCGMTRIDHIRQGILWEAHHHPSGSVLVSAGIELFFFLVGGIMLHFANVDTEGMF